MGLVEELVNQPSSSSSKVGSKDGHMELLNSSGQPPGYWQDFDLAKSQVSFKEPAFRDQACFENSLDDEGTRAYMAVHSVGSYQEAGFSTSVDSGKVSIPKQASPSYEEVASLLLATDQYVKHFSTQSSLLVKLAISRSDQPSFDYFIKVIYFSKTPY